ncbi:MAG: hypothetical protein EAZ74_01965 [Alphaproteobacteria bacterium]|nr:MAG: hypothetical protein EAZ74_01965 [Alphaproteobacteria bacterium]TAF74992.1 MAG: hypothetical protein EAZ52_07625 [Alphaproteobacteria bacterium]
MVTNSINTNMAATNAQRNMRIASDSASRSISRLSSGNRITSASDDISGMILGNTLKKEVSTLRAVLQNAAQGASMLEVASGSLEQVADILMRQKALTVQASAGSVSNAERILLNQTFQDLSQEINRLVGSANFNGVNLIDGSLTKSAMLTTNANNTTATASQIIGQTTAGGANTITVGNGLAEGDTISFNGFQAMFTTAARGTVAAAGKVSIGADNPTTARNLVEFLNQSTDARLANFSFKTAAVNGAAIDVFYTGGNIVGNSGNAPDMVTVSIVDGAVAAAGIALGDATMAFRPTVTTDEDGLHATAYDLTGSILANTRLTSDGVDLTASAAAAGETGIQNNAAFIGNVFQNLTVTATGVADTLNFQMQVGNVLYRALNVDVVDGNPTFITMAGVNASNNAVVEGGEFRFKLAANAFTAGTYTVQQATEFTNELRNALSELNVRQNRNVTSFAHNNSSVSVNAVQVANLRDMRANFISDNFTNVRIEDIRVFAPEVGSTDARIQVKIDGEWYHSQSGIGTEITRNRLIAFSNSTDPTKSFNMTTGTTGITGSATVTMNLSTHANAEAVETELKRAFGITNGQAGTQFQMGSDAADAIGLEIDSVDTHTIFDGLSLDILTSGSATTAGAQIDLAINSVKQAQAAVGGIQSRFEYGMANLETAIANQDAARAAFLDTDWAAESTAFASAQVQLQAGISVLAQANLLQQQLLKLIE